MEHLEHLLMCLLTACLSVLPSTGCRVESISLNIEAVNTHRERPEVSVSFPLRHPLGSWDILWVPFLCPVVAQQGGCLGRLFNLVLEVSLEDWEHQLGSSSA